MRRALVSGLFPPFLSPLWCPHGAGCLLAASLRALLITWEGFHFVHVLVCQPLWGLEAWLPLSPAGLPLSALPARPSRPSRAGK